MSDNKEVKQVLGLIFKASPPLKHKDKKVLDKLVAKSFSQKEGQEVEKKEGNIMDKINYKEIPDILDVQLDAKAELNEALIKLHWNTPKYWETAGQQDNYWSKNNIDELDSSDYDSFFKPVQEINLLKLKKN